MDTGFNGGLYRDGQTRLIKSSIEAGYMLYLPHFEVAGAVDSLAVDAYESVIWRAAVGLNWYVYRHRLKFQFMQRETFNDLGVRDARAHATFVQAQIMF